MKRKTPFLIKALGVIALASAIGASLMLAVYLVPTSQIRANLKQDIDLLYHEGDFPSIAPSFEYARPDGSTDALMLNEASYQDERSLAEQAMANPSCFNLSDSEQRTHILKLVLEEDNCNQAYRQNYGRYWHGYLLFLKPALAIMGIQSLRLVGVFCFFVVASLFIICVYKYLGSKYVYGAIFAVLLLNPATTALSFQFWSIFYISVLATIIILAKYKWLEKKNERIYYLFLLSGILVAFFDYLTYPIVACFVPLVFYLVRQGQLRVTSLKTDAFKSLKLVAIWALGWAGMWASKWAIGSLLTGQNILAEAVGSANYRLGGEIIGDAVSWHKAIIVNLQVLFIPAILLLVFALLLLLSYLVLAKRYRFSKDLAKRNLTLLLITLAPIVWYAILANHSQFHHFFTYKNLTISALAIYCYVATILIPPSKKRGA